MRLYECILALLLALKGRDALWTSSSSPFTYFSSYLGYGEKKDASGVRTLLPASRMSQTPSLFSTFTELRANIMKLPNPFEECA